jgi:hypothetical protein
MRTSSHSGGGKLLACLLLGGFALTGCSDAGPLGPADSVSGAGGAVGAEDAAVTDDRAGSPALGVLTWNIYVGADLAGLLALDDPSDLEIALAVTDLFGDVIAADFPARAGAIADQVAAFNPHVIGLNEVSTFDFASTPGVELDYLAILMAQLAARNLDYVLPVDGMAEARSKNFEVTLPIVTATGLDFVTLVDYDVILLRADIAATATNPMNATFAQPLPIPIRDDLTIIKPSGWASVDIVLKDLPYRVFTTHIEPADTGPCATDNPGLLFVHNAQAGELMGILDASLVPVVLTGDLNSDASGCTTPTYGNLLESGFVDAWTVGSPRGPGYTSNQDADLLNATSKLFHRIDFVMYRDAFTSGGGQFQGSAQAELVGEEVADKTPGGLWPSDHAGVLAELSIAPGLGHAE